METVQTPVNEICPTKTQAWVKKGALLVDVREKDEVEFLSFDVPNIVNIPLCEFENRLTELPLDREIVMVCRNGERSLRATGFLINHGYNPSLVVNMKHGIIRWVQRGFPTTGDASIISDSANDGGCCSTAVIDKKDNSCCGSHHSHN